MCDVNVVLTTWVPEDPIHKTGVYGNLDNVHLNISGVIQSVIGLTLWGRRLLKVVCIHPTLHPMFSVWSYVRDRPVLGWCPRFQ